MSGAIHPLPQYSFMVWCLVKHRDNLTLLLANKTEITNLTFNFCGRCQYFPKVAFESPNMADIGIGYDVSINTKAIESLRNPALFSKGIGDVCTRIKAVGAEISRRSNFSS
jgi:hypothetical protein